MNKSPSTQQRSPMQQAAIGVALLLIIATAIGLGIVPRFLTKHQADPIGFATAPMAALPIQGDLEAGEELFFSPRLACAQCHRVGDRGGVVGPDLTSVNKRYTHYSYLQLAILQPGENVSTSYAMCTVSDKQGRAFSGILRSEQEDPIELWQTNGEIVTIPRAEVDQIQQEAMSPMPNDYADRLKVRELFDLIAFLLHDRTHEDTERSEEKTQTPAKASRGQP